MKVADQVESLRANARTADWLQHAADPIEVERFCKKTGIGGALETAIRLVQKHFDLVTQLCVSVRTDPELGDDFVVIHVVTQKTSDEAPEAYEGVVRELVTCVEREKRKRISIYYTVN